MQADLPTLLASGLYLAGPGAGIAGSHGSSLKGRIPDQAAGLFKMCVQAFVRYPCNPQLFCVMQIPLWPYEEC